MADLGDALYRAICKRSPRTEPNTVGEAVAWFVRKAGSVSGAARLAGVPRRSFRDWVAGKSRPRGDRAAAIVAAARAGERRGRLGARREARLRALDPADIAIAATYNYSGPPRYVEIGKYLIHSVMNDLLDAFLSGASTDELREVFAAGMTGDASDFYPTSFARPSSDENGWSVDSVDFDGGGRDE